MRGHGPSCEHPVVTATGVPCGNGDPLAAATAVLARALLALHLADPGQVHRVAGRRHEPELSGRVGDEQTGGGDTDGLDAALGK